jgi:hypothetical protein
VWGSGDRRVLDTAILPTGRQLKSSNASAGRCHDDERLKVHSFSNAANTPSSRKSRTFLTWNGALFHSGAGRNATAKSG